MYAAGHGVPKDNAEALKWYRKAVNQGDAQAQYHLGGMYLNGEGVPQNYAEAVHWFRKAADLGNVDAQYWLGYFYFQGRIVPENPTESAKWYRKALNRGWLTRNVNWRRCTQLAEVYHRIMCRHTIGVTSRLHMDLN